MVKPIGALNKRARQALERRDLNRQHRSKLRSALRKAQEAIVSKSENSPDFVREAVSLAAHSASKGVIHKNKASRISSRLMKKLNLAGLSKKPTKTKATKAKATKAKATKAKATKAKATKAKATKAKATKAK